MTPTRVAARVAVTALRREPSRRSERTSEALLGEPLAVLTTDVVDGDRWHRVRGADGYEGWIAGGAVAKVPSGWPGPDPFRVGALTAVARDPDDGGAIRRLVFGGILAVDAREGDRVRVRLPGDEPAMVSARDGRLYYGKDGDRAPLADILDGLWGIPYRWGGRSVDGLDCSGLTQLVCGLRGLALPRDAWQQEAHLAGLDLAVSPDALVEGDLIFWGRGERATHVGIMLDGKRFAHAREWVRTGHWSTGPDRDLADRVRGAYRPPTGVSR